MNTGLNKTYSVPSGLISSCQMLLNNLAELAQVPAALIMKLDEPHIEVYASNESPNNPYKVEEKVLLPGLYCETVIKKQGKLLITNALKDKDWDKNPDIELGMVSYLGFPLLFPNGNIFGTICILDSKERFFDERDEKVILMVKNIFEENLKSIYLVAEKNSILEMIAHGNSLVETLDVLIQGIEDQLGNVRCSVLLLDESGKMLHKGSGPSLPKAYCDAFDGFEIGPDVRACGAAAFKNETIIIEDIETDPNWAGFKNIAISHGLKSCWSVPIRSTAGKVLGTLCSYFNKPKKPTVREMEIVFYSAYLAGIAIQLKQGEAVLQKREKLARDFFEKMLSILEGTSSESGDSFYRSLVHNLASVLNVRYAFFTKAIGPHKNQILSIWMGKEFGENFEYDTRGTPCEDLGNGEVVCYYPEKIQEHYRDDYMLVDWEVESYLGVRLLDSLGNQVGSMVIMDDKPILNGEILTMILSTLALRGQAELIRHKNDRELNLAKEAAEKASLAKSEFLSRMSHELRTPMNAILGFTQLMEMDTENSLADLHKQNLGYVTSAGKHLLKLINEVLDLSNIEFGKIKLNMTPLDLSKVVDGVISISRQLAEENGIVIKVQNFSRKNYIVEVDDLRIKQVILNLLTNAIKYNKINGTVTVTFEEYGNNMVRLGVKDTGIGISSDERDKLFKPFERFHINSDFIEGTGIGLSISKQLIEIMDGTIGYESLGREGSFFYIDLKLSGKTPLLIEVEKEMNESTLEGGNAKKVLYIDDLCSNIDLISQVLSQRPDVKLLSALTALDGIELAVINRPDLILMDIQMPDMDGLTAFKRLQILDATKSIPVIALTADAMDYDIKKALDMGFVSYITKPIDIPHFLEILDKTLSD
jgi:signal transduction histidine kinase/GAF domain-containing protein/ActR/RegA family two-component response regulator